MASDDDGPPDTSTHDPAADQTWLKKDNVRAKRGKHGARVVEPTGTIERSFTVSFRSTGKNVNMNRLHYGVVEKIFEAVPGVIFRPTSTSTTRTKKPLTSIEQFPATEIGHGNFFERRQKGKTIEVDHKIHSAMSIREIKNKIMSYLRPNNIFIEKGKLDGIELFRFGYLQGAHPRLVNRLDLEDKINDAINDFPSLDEYWKTYAPDWTMSEDLPRVSVYKKEIGWGMGTSRVTSECVTLMAIRPVCVLYKHIINECKGLFHYDFIPTGTAAMTTSEQVKDLLINNNDIQNSIQGISVMGLPEMALYLEYGHNNQVKTIKQWILHHPGVETMESTDESSTDGRWIVIVLREEFDSAKTWIEEILNQIPEIMPEFDYKVFASKFEVFPPALFTNAPLGGKMQKDVNDTYARVMAKKDRYTKTESKKSGNAWQPRTPIFFDATPENFPTLGKQKKNQDRPSGDEANSIESTVKTTPTRTAQTIISTDIETIVSKMDSVLSQYTHVFEKLMSDAKEQRIEDRKQRDEERRIRDADRKAFEQQRLIDRELIERSQAEERRERAEEKRQDDARFERLLQEHKEQQLEMLKLIASIVNPPQMMNQPMPQPMQNFSPLLYPNFYPLAPPQLNQFPINSTQQPDPNYHNGTNLYAVGGVGTDSNPIIPTPMQPPNARQTDTRTATPKESDPKNFNPLNPDTQSITASANTQSKATAASPTDATQLPQCLTPSRHIMEKVGQRRRYDQITSTPDSAGTDGTQQKNPALIHKWERDQEWEEDDPELPARSLNFGDPTLYEEHDGPSSDCRDKFDEIDSQMTEAEPVSPQTTIANNIQNE